MFSNTIRVSKISKNNFLFLVVTLSFMFIFSINSIKNTQHMCAICSTSSIWVVGVFLSKNTLRHMNAFKWFPEFWKCLFKKRFFHYFVFFSSIAIDRYIFWVYIVLYKHAICCYLYTQSAINSSIFHRFRSNLYFRNMINILIKVKKK